MAGWMIGTAISTILRDSHIRREMKVRSCAPADTEKREFRRTLQLAAAAPTTVKRVDHIPRLTSNLYSDNDMSMRLLALLVLAAVLALAGIPGTASGTAHGGQHEVVSESHDASLPGFCDQSSEQHTGENSHHCGAATVALVGPGTESMVRPPDRHASGLTTPYTSPAFDPAERPPITPVI